MKKEQESLKKQNSKKQQKNSEQETLKKQQTNSKKEQTSQKEEKSSKKQSNCKKNSKTQQKSLDGLCFDNDLYLKLQSENINKRIKKFGNKLYLEFGGKIFDDLHAARVLPGFDPNIKIKLLALLKDKAEIVFCISSNDIEKNKIRADLGLSYSDEVLRLVDNMRAMGLYVSAFVITLFKGQPSATKFGKKLEQRGERVYFHRYTKGYPNDVATIVSDEGYGANPFVETTRPLVVVTAPGPSSGKLATCLSQLYHEYKRGVKAGYAKFETFPVWNLPLKHPVNIAYEAATADLYDVNQIDPFHFNAYGTLSVNYNRDIAVFPVLHNILEKITHTEIYKSPTDMGVNMVGFAIVDDELAKLSARKEILRRYYRAECDFERGQCTFETLERNKSLVAEADATADLLPVIEVAKTTAKKSGYPCVALELKGCPAKECTANECEKENVKKCTAKGKTAAKGKAAAEETAKDNAKEANAKNCSAPENVIVTGKTKKIVSAAAAVVLNALRTLAGLGDDFDIITDDILLPIVEYRTKVLKNHCSVLTLDDVLVALSICTGKNAKAKKAMQQISRLAGCDAHCTYILSHAEEQTLKKLGINITCEPVFLNSNLFEE